MSIVQRKWIDFKLEGELLLSKNDFYLLYIYNQLKAYIMKSTYLLLVRLRSSVSRKVHFIRSQESEKGHLYFVPT